MSTNIRVDVDSDGLRKRLREQQQAQRLAYLEKGRQKGVEQDALAAKATSDQQLIRQFPQPLTKETLNRRGYRQDELAAFRGGCPRFVRLINPDSNPEYQWATVQFTGTVPLDPAEPVYLRTGLAQHQFAVVTGSPGNYIWDASNVYNEWWHLSTNDIFDAEGCRTTVNDGFNMIKQNGAGDGILFNEGDYVNPSFNFGYNFIANRSLLEFRPFRRWWNYQTGQLELEPGPIPTQYASAGAAPGPWIVGVETRYNSGPWVDAIWAVAGATFEGGPPTELRAVVFYSPLVLDFAPVNPGPSVAANCVYKR